MRDKYKIILMVVFLFIGLLVIFFGYDNNYVQSDALRFKGEYESLNGKSNKSGNNYLVVDIPDNNVIKYASFEEIREVLTRKSGVIYFGFPECPWCRNMIGPLLDSASKFDIKQIYYFNAHDIRDSKHLDDDGNIVVDYDGTSSYYELIDLMNDFLTPYEGLNDESIKRLYFPTVVFVKDGKIKDIHIGTVDEQSDPYIPLSSSQKNELIDIFSNGIKKVVGTTCGDKC
ncbi:MAG: hypothetical protein J6D28_01340 [Bacilli bacterium]|nr:hypothetical protein [Bacilli bacterium]